MRMDFSILIFYNIDFHFPALYFSMPIRDGLVTLMEFRMVPSAAAISIKIANQMLQ